VHHYIYKVQWDAALVSWFYYKITLHVSGTFRTHHQEYKQTVVPVLYQWPWTTVHCTPDNGCGKCPKRVEWSCNKTKILVLHLGLYIYVCTHIYIHTHMVMCSSWKYYIKVTTWSTILEKLIVAELVKFHIHSEIWRCIFNERELL
jgi:hypothetical protein